MSNASLSKESLETARKRLEGMIDATAAAGETVPPWLIAARESVKERLQDYE